MSNGILKSENYFSKSKLKMMLLHILGTIQSEYIFEENKNLVMRNKKRQNNTK